MARRSVAKATQEAVLLQRELIAEKHGDIKDQRVLANFEDGSETYQEVLQKVLIRLAKHNSAFAQQLQTVAQQANIQTGGVQGNVNVSGEGTVDLAAGVNTGTMTYHARSEDKDA